MGRCLPENNHRSDIHRDRFHYHPHEAPSLFAMEGVSHVPPYSTNSPNTRSLPELVAEVDRVLALANASRDRVRANFEEPLSKADVMVAQAIASRNRVRANYKRLLDEADRTVAGAHSMRSEIKALVNRHRVLTTAIRTSSISLDSISIRVAGQTVSEDITERISSTASADHILANKKKLTRISEENEDASKHGRQDNPGSGRGGGAGAGSAVA